MLLASTRGRRLPRRSERGRRPLAKGASSMLGRLIVVLTILLGGSMPAGIVVAGDTECTDPAGCPDTPPGGSSGNEPDNPPSRPRP